MSKYIVELKPEYEDSFKGLMILGAKDNDLFVDTLAVDDLELLNSDYINEHFGELQDMAYQRGVEDGAKSVENWNNEEKKLRLDEVYQRGLDDAWEAAKKIFGYEIDGGIPIDELGKVFGYAKDAIFCTADIIRHNTASEAIAKLKAYEEEQKEDEIKVGDEVIDKDGDKTIVTHIHGELFDGLCHDGSTMSDLFLEDVDRTGRHFNIDKILEEMKE